MWILLEKNHSIFSGADIKQVELGCIYTLIDIIKSGI